MDPVRARDLAPAILRYGMVVLFLWFGLSQVTNPSAWTVWLPEWTSGWPIAPTMLVVLNGAFETILGLMLAVGFYTRAAAGLLAIHLLGISLEIGYTAIGVRDFCLAAATAAIAFFGPDKYSFDAARAPIPREEGF